MMFLETICLVLVQIDFILGRIPDALLSDPFCFLLK